MMCNL